MADQQHQQQGEHLLRIRREQVRGMVALGRLAARVPLDQVLGVFHEKHKEVVSETKTSRGLSRCSGRWSLFQFTDSA